MTVRESNFTKEEWASVGQKMFDTIMLLSYIDGLEDDVNKKIIDIMLTTIRHVEDDEFKHFDKGLGTELSLILDNLTSAFLERRLVAQYFKELENYEKYELLHAIRQADVNNVFNIYLM